ncbi:hypothetical protein [Nannocystis radixulma]|uniref:Uncharacterized protein n=1 Tax=Nannocystis radixulma TaxID=2995305 RepID=A0ABT5BBA7_9BACT|nr:hypothetical protein [Nannocystis radixulma]MDC0670814.1 hypothetical protein [Nannocystis radixulma]
MSVHVLPPALAPWAPWLELFPAELALSLGPMVQRLAAALGPFTTPAHSGHGEPDGFSGLDRRGVYERLLPSEWLLAELAPDEFLRRAAASEHAFLRLERREPAKARTSVILFDAGPSQLGSPRLAHLAALLALARRASLGRAALAWGVLQAPDVPLVDAVTRDTIRALLARRTAVAPTAADVQSWRTCLGGQDHKDIWLIGGPTLRRLAWPGVATVELRDVLGAEPPELAADLCTAAGRTVAVRLPLPDGPTCVRLIRDPFPPDRGRPSARDRRRTRRVPATNLVIANDGSRVFAGAQGGGVIVYPVPHSAQGGVGKPKLHFPELRHSPATIGWYNRGSAALVIDPDGGAMLFYKANKSASSHESMRCHDPHCLVVPTDELRPLWFRAGLATFRDGSDTLYTFRQRPDKSTYLERQHDAPVLAAAHCEEWLAHLSFRDNGPDADFLSRWIIHSGDHRSPHFLGFERPLGAHFARDVARAWHCAVSLAPGKWQLHNDKDIHAEWTTDDRVIGLLPGHHLGDFKDHVPALVTLTSGRNFLALHRGTTRHLVSAEDPVVHATIALVTGHLAYITTRGSVVVLRPPYDAPLARFMLEDA